MPHLRLSSPQIPFPESVNKCQISRIRSNKEASLSIPHSEDFLHDTGTPEIVSFVFLQEPLIKFAAIQQRMKLFEKRTKAFFISRVKIHYLFWFFFVKGTSFFEVLKDRIENVAIGCIVSFSSTHKRFKK